MLNTRQVSFVVLTGLTVAAATLLGFVRLFGFSAPSIEKTYGFEVLDTRFRFDVATVADDLRELSPDGLQAYQAFEYADFGFMSLYTLTLFIAISYLATKWERPRWLAFAALLALAFDVAENVMILNVLGDADPSAALGWIKVIGTAKLPLFAIAALLPFVLMADRFLRRADSQEPCPPGASEKQTYFSLRLALSLLVFMLGLALLLHAVRPGCLLDSISAYYYSPLRPVFVGTLVAVGICLIVYQGTTYIENLLLDMAGFMAFIVAFAPTSMPKTEDCAASIVTDSAPHGIIVRDNVFPMLAIALVATAVVLLRHMFWSSTISTQERWRLAIGLGAQILVQGLYWFARPWFEEWAHGVAASALFGCIIAVVWSNHLARSGSGEDFKLPKNIYAWVAAYMGIALALCAGLHLFFNWVHWVIVVELLLIGGFAAFWAIQTGDLRGRANRTEPQR